MKRITVIFILIFGFTNAQFFETQQEEQTQEGSGFFGNNAPAPPEQTADARSENPGQPGENQVPIDNWLLLLPMAGIAVGVYWLRRKSKLVV